MKKFTKSSLKSFIKKHINNLYIKQDSTFDGMTDCVVSVENSGYKKIDENEIDFNAEHTWGIPGLRLVGNNRDYFTVISEQEVEICNSCGTSLIKFIL